MPDCPTCPESYPTERGVMLHHAKTHGESIAKEEFVCEYCGEVDEFYPSWENGKYCSEKCMGQDMTGEKNPAKRPEVGDKISEALSGQDRPWFKGDKNPQKDPEVRRKNSEAHKGKSLSEETKRKISATLKQYWSENPHPFEKLAGENHPRWKGGAPYYYGPTWTEELRESIRERDDRECQECGIPESELDKRLDVHHIVPFSEFGQDYHEEANDPENLISLCHRCHLSVEPRAVKSVS